jgi:hypothetical protein
LGIFIKIGNCEERLPYIQVLLAFGKVQTFQPYTMPTLKENLFAIYTNTLTESTFTLSIIYIKLNHILKQVVEIPPSAVRHAWHVLNKLLTTA